MIPLFMAGDKQYFYYAQQLRKRTGVDLVILGENMLERTDFKTGFASVRPYQADQDHVYTLPTLSQLRLLAYYGREFLTNRAYWNMSLIDTLFAYCCYYLMHKEYLNLYSFIPWSEDEINYTIKSEYDWESATDTQSTWRIGDGTSAFYNLIYMTVAGFTENDALRSNQIREGLISREQALHFIVNENRPRFETIQWYLNVIRLNKSLHEVVEMIIQIPKFNLKKL